MDPYASLYHDTVDALEGVLPDLKEHQEETIPEGSEHTIGSMARTFDNGTYGYRQMLAQDDPEAQAEDTLTGLLHWMHREKLDVVRILAGGIAHFVYENNHEV